MIKLYHSRGNRPATFPSFNIITYIYLNNKIGSQSEQGVVKLLKRVHLEATQNTANRKCKQIGIIKVKKPVI